MVRIKWVLVLVFALVSSGLVFGGVRAAECTEPIRIGALTPAWGPTPQVVGLRDGLLELGYREDEDFVIGVRFTQGNRAALSVAARALVHYGVDLIIADTDDAAQAAQMATFRIPIVFAGVGDPVGLGLVESFAQPGGNITGVADLELALSPKRLELFREIIPGLKRVLFTYDAAEAYAVAVAKVYREAAHRLGIALMERAVRTMEEAEATLAQVRKDEVDGLLTLRCCSLNIPGLVLEATSQQRVPTMFSSAFLVERGGFASYGPNSYETGRQAARLVDKIIKGVNPADIPVEVNTKIEFAINLKTAKALGLTIPPEVLFQATKVIR